MSWEGGLVPISDFVRLAGMIWCEHDTSEIKLLLTFYLSPIQVADVIIYKNERAGELPRYGATSGRSALTGAYPVQTSCFFPWHSSSETF